MKVLNCNCKQCKHARGRRILYVLQRRKVRRLMQRKLQYAVVHRNYEVDLPVKHHGVYAA
jgi:hypothetical protein